MSKRAVRLLLIVVIVAMLITGCSTEETLVCTIRFNVILHDLSGAVVSQAEYHGPSNWQKYGINSYAYQHTEKKVIAFETQVNEKLETLNARLKKLYPSGGMLPEPMPYRFNISRTLMYRTISRCDGLDNNAGSAIFVLYPQIVNSARYQINTRASASIAYVSVASPGGSRIEYSYPLSWLQPMLAATFNNEYDDIDLKKAQFAIQPPTVNQEEYVQALLADATNAENVGVEAVAITLNVADFEGRQELKPVISRAIVLGALEQQKPVRAIIRAALSNGQRGVSGVTVQDGRMKMNGLWIFGSGMLQGEGGGFSVSSSSETWLEDTIRASVYLLPAR